MVAVLCHCGFVVRGLQRLQIETLSDDAAMLRSPERNGFVREGVLRSSAWVMGEFLDEVLLGRSSRTGSRARRTEAVPPLENRWSGAAVRHYRAAEPSRLVKDVPLYTL